MAEASRSEPPLLADLRREIDRIDESMHRLLMERGDIIDRLISVKRTQDTGSAFRPAREAQMMRRLVERHRGILPLDTAESIWRLAITLLLLSRALERSSLIYGFAAGIVAGFMVLGRDQVALIGVYVLAGLVVAAIAMADSRCGPCAQASCRCSWERSAPSSSPPFRSCSPPSWRRNRTVPRSISSALERVRCTLHRCSPG